MTIQEQPAEMVTQGKNNAKLLMDIVSQKNWAVNINGKKYLQFEAWQTLARFYGLTVRTTETKFVNYGTTTVKKYDKFKKTYTTEEREVKGFEAISEVVNKEGVIVGRGEGACLTDEDTWFGRPLFSLKAMAQTRASGRALRQMLSWIAVLGGYAPTAAEEMPRETQVEVVEKLICREKFVVLKGLLSKVNPDQDELKKMMKVTNWLDLTESKADMLIARLQEEKAKMNKHDEINLDEIAEGIEAQNIKK